VLGGLIAEHMPSGPLSAARDSADLQSQCHHRGYTVTCSTGEEQQPAVLSEESFADEPQAMLKYRLQCENRKIRRRIKTWSNLRTH